MKKQVINAVALAVAAVGVFGALVWRTQTVKQEQVSLTCYQKLAELDTVAKIATATGVRPGEPRRDPIGTKYKVNPNTCK